MEYNILTCYSNSKERWIAYVREGKKTIASASDKTSEAIAVEKLKIKLGAIQTEIVVTTGDVAEWCEMCMKKYVQPKQRPNTFEGYKRRMNKHIVNNPKIGSLKLEDVNYLTMQNLANNMLADGYKHNSVTQVIKEFRALLRYAVVMDKCNENVLRPISMPKQVKPVEELLNSDQQERLLKSFEREDCKHGNLFAFMYHSGLRRSEALALTWNDVDWDKRRLTVNKSLVFTDGVPTINPTKNQSSTRVIPMDDNIRLCLVRAMGKKHEKSSTIFHNGHGGHMQPMNTTRYFKEHVNRVDEDLKKLTLHDLRGLCSSNLIAKGVNPYLVAKYLGHSSPQTTLKSYITTNYDILENAILGN